MCRMATGDPALWWMDHFKARWATPPRRRALVIGCGNGWAERDLADRGIAMHFDAFDASPVYLQQAEAARGDRPIRYFQADFTTFRPEGRYDCIINVAALHHARHLYRLCHLLAGALEPDGIFVNWEYVGPSRNQYARQHVAIMEGVNASLPPRFRTPHLLISPIETFLAGDPTEAVHSAEILRAFTQYFDVLHYRPLGGGVAYQLLWNNIREFQGDDPEAARILEGLIRLDEELTRAAAVPSLFAYFVGRPRQDPPAWRALVDRLAREPLREAFADATGGFYPRQFLENLLRPRRS